MNNKININTEEHWDSKYQNLDVKKVIGGNHRILYERLVDIIFKFHHNSILDLGAGIGPIPYLLKKRKFDFNNRRYVCVDFSIHGLKKIKQMVPEVETIHARIDTPLEHTQLNFSSFDLVLCIEVFEHLTNYITALINCKNYVTETGIIIISIPFGHIMVKEHYHKIITKEQIISVHKAVDLIPVSVDIIDRWIVIKSRTSKFNGLSKNKRKKSITLLDMRIS